MGAYEIIQADIAEHKSDIIGIINRNLGGHSGEWYSWKYDNSTGGVKCLLAKDASTGNFVGSSALFCRNFMLAGKPARSAVSGDFAVDKRHRAYGPAMRLIKTALDRIGDDNIEFVYSLPNKLSAALLEKAGYQEAGRMRRYVKILRAGAKVRKYIKAPFLSKIVSKISDFFVFNSLREIFYKGLSNTAIKELPCFDRRFDDLWNKSRGQFKIAGERNAVFLNWRYFNSVTKYKLLALTRDGEVLSYLVYRIENNNSYIDDMLAVNDEALKTHISKAISYFRKNGTDSISVNYFGGGRLKSALAEFNFMPREEGLKVLFYTNDARKKEMLLNAQNWYFMQGDNDA